MNYQSLSIKQKIKQQLLNLQVNEKLSYGGLKTLSIIEELVSQLKEN